MSSFISLSTSSSSGFGIRSFTSTDHENLLKPKKEKELSSFISLSCSSSPTSTLGSYTSTIDVIEYKRFEKERKEFNNGRKWFSRLISPFVKQVDNDNDGDKKVEILDDWSRGRFWRGV